MSRIHHGGRQLEVLVGHMANSTTTILVFFARRGDEAIPIEVRFTGSKPPTPTEAFDLLDNYPVVNEPPMRLTTQLLRSFSLGDALAATQNFHRSSSTDRDLSGVPHAEWVVRSGDHLFGYRNTRDLIAAVERLHAALVYVTAVRAGEKRPTRTVMEQLGLESLTRARNLIAGARREGFLSGGSPGVAGGSLTERATVFADALGGLKQAAETAGDQGSKGRRRK